MGDLFGSGGESEDEDDNAPDDAGDLLASGPPGGVLERSLGGGPVLSPGLAKDEEHESVVSGGRAGHWSSHGGKGKTSGDVGVVGAMPRKTSPGPSAAVQAEAARLLTENKKDEFGDGPLNCAAYEGKAELCAAMIKAGAKVDDPSEKKGWTALYLASEKGHDKVVSMLLGAGADVNKARDDGATPLYFASQYGHDKVVSMLLGAGADVNKAKDNGATPLYIASCKGHDKVVSMLLGAGADVNKAKDNGATPLYIASEKGRDKVVSVLLGAGADVNKGMDGGWTPLIKASTEGHDKVVSVLLGAGADINKARDVGTTPLFMASQNGHDKVVSMLLGAGADINKAMDKNVTPLMVASCFGHTDGVQQLLDAGASLDDKMTGKNDIMKCGAGSTALSIAQQKGHETIVALLRSKGAQ